ncbi:hypothetical protein [Paraburkholderia adhaesiva]|uniref:hypothetical protein n=1 Tax=Paraburkholderia adhaesiva TaxID=2883244 RepID=UPI001F3259F2|nr:hypothetical protein [Paraburkholderia adhaesiva]
MKPELKKPDHEESGVKSCREFRNNSRMAVPSSLPYDAGSQDSSRVSGEDARLFHVRHVCFEQRMVPRIAPFHGTISEPAPAQYFGARFVDKLAHPERLVFAVFDMEVLGRFLAQERYDGVPITMCGSTQRTLVFYR